MMGSVEPENASLACEIIKKVVIELSSEEETLSIVVQIVEALVAKIGRCIVNFYINSAELKEVRETHDSGARIFKVFDFHQPIDPINSVQQ